MPDWAEGVYVLGEYAYIANRIRGLRVIDVSNPTDPQEVGYYSKGGEAHDVHVSGDYAYVANGRKGLRVVDISDPTNPQEVGHYDTPWNAMDVHVSEGYAYVADDRSGLRVVDVSSPADPREVGHVDSRNQTLGVFTSGDYAYMADNVYVRVIDISDKSNPREAGFFRTVGMAYDVYVAGDYAYVANGDGGLVILRIKELPTLEVTPSALSFLAEAGEGNPHPQNINIGSTGSVVSWTAIISPTVDWLDVSPTSGTTPATIQAHVRIAGLEVGEYTTHIVIDAGAEVGNSPQAVPVRLVNAERMYVNRLPLVLGDR
ncbi:MAG: hypothetical protein ACUVXG_00065 [Anaerolineae bacterium]